MIDERQHWVRRFVRAKSPHYLSEKVDDITQDIMVRLVKADQRKVTVITNYGYIKQTAMSVMIDHIRKYKVKRALEDDFGEAEPPVAANVKNNSQESPESWAENQWMLEQVYGVLDGFPEDKQTSLMLYLRGLKIKDIAGLTGFKISKVRNDIYRGKDELLKQLNQLGISYEV